MFFFLCFVGPSLLFAIASSKSIAFENNQIGAEQRFFQVNIKLGTFGKINVASEQRIRGICRSNGIKENFKELIYPKIGYPKFCCSAPSPAIRTRHCSRQTSTTPSSLDNRRLLWPSRWTFCQQAQE
jgi:hypothetical protein